ncbi:MAG: hypothetical protein AVDCRST_MAG17-812 [uncultured Solirubrobacterales bacterium]|uniref:Uncharacterized protein n=1 Tax=uncultured Solirubrobacterales bacterium TaxID=768556 RepID=A0A6J4SHB2_9ACTN|nr:MAG: hypothetical protein AVDCRST_MAG17-812 [uncultured Solirubrobacterales bacterium]
MAGVAELGPARLGSPSRDWYSSSLERRPVDPGGTVGRRRAVLELWRAAESVSTG